MKIISLHIYHFGALSDCKLTLDSSGLQLLFGENEAGKTTVMDFIKCMLFGFPSRKETQRRYEPKNGNRLGGKIRLEHPELGVWMIERIEGSKVSGDVRIYNDAGQNKEVAFLEDLIGSIDQSLFQGVYCFGLDGLQKLDKLTEEDLGNFLLSTAISGDRDLLEIEQEFEKRQSELFKKSGKKPILNEKLEHLRALEKTLNQFREKNESYKRLDEQADNLQQKIEQASLVLKQTQKEIGWYIRLFELKPVFEKYKQLKIQLQAFKGKQMAFPENGIHRYEQWQKEWSLLNGELKYLEGQLLKLENSQKGLQIDEQLETHSKAIKQMFNKLAQIELLNKQSNELKQQLADLEKEETELYDGIGQDWGEKEINGLTLSLSSVHEHEQLVKRNESIKEKKDRLEGDLEEARLKLESLEKEEKEWKGKLLPDDVFNRLAQEQNKNSAASIPFAAAVLPVIAAILLIWSGWTSDKWIVMLMGAGILAAAGLTFFLFNKKGSPQKEGQYNKDQRFLQEEVYRKQLIELTAALAHENKAYMQIAKQIDYLEVEEARVIEGAEGWAGRNGFSRNVEQLMLPGLMNSLYKLKDVLKQKKGAIQRLKEINREMMSFDEQVRQLASATGMTPDENTFELITVLNDKLDQHKKNVIEREHLEKNRKDLEHRKEAVVLQAEVIQQEISRLWQEAEAEKEEEYYKKGKEAVLFHQLSEEWKSMENQLLSFGFPLSELDKNADSVTDEHQVTVTKAESFKEEEEKLTKELTFLTEEKAKCDWEMKKLLEDGSYSEHMHRYELLKEEWKATAKKWAAYRLAQHGLQVVKESYQQTKLPAVLKTSSGYFSKITEGEYQSIIFTETNQMLLVRADGTRFFPYELSRGTAEQVYLSIRLAVAAHSGPKCFPVFMDDIAVNFDERRTRRTLSLIQDFARDRQVLFFTCHQHLQTLVPTAPLKHMQNYYVQT